MPAWLGDDIGVRWRIWLGLPSGGDMVASLYSSVVVDSWWVKGDGRCDLLSFRGVPGLSGGCT